jgi:ABC-type antimicrobial peptide transport system permease subunit
MTATGKYKICGIVDMKNPKINDLSVFMPLKTTQNYLSAPNRITNLVIDKSKNISTEELINSLRNKLDKSEFEVLSWKTMLPELEQTIIADSVGGIIMVFILYMIITFGIFGTVLMMTQERIYELGVMVSIGMKKLKLIWMLILETLILSLVGIITGSLLVAPFVFYFYKNTISLAGDQAAVMEKFGFESTVPLLTDFSIPLTHGLIIFCISLIIAIYPTVTVLRLNTVKAMKR